MKVLIVDDSVVYRMAISQALEKEPGISELESASNGSLAVEKLKSVTDFDLVTLDMEMPIMDGIETIKEIRKFNKEIKIVVFSSITLMGAEKTLQALELGANDFCTKEEAGGAKSIDKSITMIKETLLPKIQALVLAKPVEAKEVRSVSPSLISLKPKLLAIGSSTGGPNALSFIFKNLKEKPQIPILLVQHMPKFFTEKLAQMLNGLTPLVEFKEAVSGEALSPGVCYVAPGDYHMVVKKNGVLELNQNEKVCFVRPSVDVTLSSLAENYEERVAVIVLTGMGEDGANGAMTLSKKGTQVFVQDEESSVVWGMPGATKDKVEDAKVLSLDEIPSLVNELLG